MHHLKKEKEKCIIIDVVELRVVIFTERVSSVNTVRVRREEQNFPASQYNFLF